MSMLDGAYERALVAVASRASDTSILVIAIGIYLGGGLALPIILSWSTGWLVAANLASVSVAGSLLASWSIIHLQARDRRHLLEWSSDLRRLDSQEFEWLVAEVLRREGWQVEETGGHGVPDEAIDLIATRGSEHRIVQCKRWAAWQVGVDDIRAFAGALLRDGRSGKEGLFVTLSGFTPTALDEAGRMGLAVWSGRDLLGRIESVRRSEPCPTCGKAMTLDQSPYGWWFRCLTPGCGGKRDLGRDPARAVEILTTPPG